MVAKKKTTARLAKATKLHVKAKSSTKTARSAPRRARRKAPSARRNAPRARERAVRDASTRSSKQSRTNRHAEAMPTQEMEPAGVAEEMMPQAAEFHPSRDPLRCGYHDSANHSKPEVQLQKQHTRVLRGPERRPTMRGH